MNVETSKKLLTKRNVDPYIIEAILQEKGITKIRMQKELGISNKNITTNLMSNEIGFYNKLAEYLGVPPNYFEKGSSIEEILEKIRHDKKAADEKEIEF